MNDQAPSLPPPPQASDAAAPSQAPAPPAGLQPSPEPGLGKWIKQEALPDARPGTAWFCVHEETQAQGLIVACLREDPSNTKIWERLNACDTPHLLRPLDAFDIKGKRWEVYERPKGNRLSREIQGIGRACPALVATLLSDLADALDALHKVNLAHCHLSPDTLFVERNGASMHLTVGGLESVACIDRREPLQFATDPFYAPPEAAGTLKHEAGNALKAWDWWTAGRIMQELVLGRHVLEYMLDHPLSRKSPEDQTCAEELLLEKFNAETRAGAVEAMPAMDKHVDLMLRGLLTVCREARWGSEEVREWLGGGSPKERYRLPRNERLFTYRSKAYTITEAAEVLGLAENWEDASKQVLDKKSPYTFATFLIEQPELRGFATKLDDALVLNLSVDLRNYPPAVRNEVILAIALMKLSGGPLIWRGRRVDEACLREMLADTKAIPNRLACVQAFCSPVVLLPLETGDPEACRTLGDGAKLANKAIQLATQAEWLIIAGPQGVSNIWRLCWESSSALTDARKQLQDSYAFSDRKEVQDLFEKQTPSPEEALLLAWMLPIADRLGFITHEVWEERQHGILAARGAALASALFWLRLKTTLNLGLPWFGNLPTVFILGLLSSGLIALAWPGPEYLPGALVPLILALGARFAITWVLPLLVSNQFPNIKWRLFDGSRRCRKEFLDVLPHEMGKKAIQKELEEINGSIVKYSRGHSTSLKIIEPGHFQELRMLGSLSWCFLLIPSGFALYHLHTLNDPIGRFEYAWTPEDERHLEYLPPEPKVKLDFPFTPPNAPRILPVLHSEPATRVQVKLALRRGIYLARDYKPDEINAMILVKMDHVIDHAFMIYDPRERKVIKEEIIFLPITPNRRTWARIDNNLVFLPDY